MLLFHRPNLSSLYTLLSGILGQFFFFFVAWVIKTNLDKRSRARPSALTSEGCPFFGLCPSCWMVDIQEQENFFKKYTTSMHGTFMTRLCRKCRAHSFFYFHICEIFISCPTQTAGGGLGSTLFLVYGHNSLSLGYYTTHVPPQE